MKLLVEEFKKRREILLYIILYLTLYSITYIFGVSKLYGYLGVSLHINWTKFFISSIIVLITIFLLPTKMEKASHHLYYIIYIITYLPTASYYWLNDKYTVYFLELSACFIFMELLIGAKTKKAYGLKVGNGHILLSAFLTIYIISTITLIVMNGGIKMQMLDFIFATQAREDNISGYAGYLLNWCAKSLMPLFLAYYKYLDKRKWVFIISLLQIGLFFSYGFKSFLLSVAYLVIVSYALKAGWKFWKVLPALFSAINFVALLLFVFKIDNMLLFLFPFRTLTLPCEGQFRYFEYFNTFEKLHFGGSFLGNLFGIKSNYSQSIGHVISIYFTGNVSNSNTGVFSYAYADFGFFGMILAVLVLALIFKIVDCSTRHIPQYLTVGAMSYQMVCMNDTNLMINLNTGGVLISICMLIILDSVFREGTYKKKFVNSSEISFNHSR